MARGREADRLVGNCNTAGAGRAFCPHAGSGASYGRAMDADTQDWRVVWGDTEVMAAMVRQLMAECRARRAAEDAAATDGHHESFEVLPEHPLLA